MYALLRQTVNMVEKYVETIIKLLLSEFNKSIYDVCICLLSVFSVYQSVNLLCLNSVNY